jgi:hypothetical protein
MWEGKKYRRAILVHTVLRKEFEGQSYKRAKCHPPMSPRRLICPNGPQKMMLSL